MVQKSARSIRSIKSTLSSKSGLSQRYRDERRQDDAIHGFDNMLMIACARFQCPYAVTVKKEIKQDDYHKTLKQSEQRMKSKRISLISQIKSGNDLEPDSASSSSIAATSSVYLNTITVTMVYDNYNNLIEILFTNVKEIPRVLLRIIGLLVPYYRNLTSVKISKCGINMYTIYELNRILIASTITDMCLDGSSLQAVDFTMLLETANLRNLSLCRCSVCDDTCKLLAEKLHYMASAQNLLLLNLSTNRITDEGAKCIANALRTNRHLRYLNLADNHITDCGAGHILDVLTEFPLTHDEIINTRRRRWEYLKCRNDLYSKYLAECCNSSFDEFSQISRKSTMKKRKTSASTLKTKSSARKERERSASVAFNADYIKAKAEMMTAEIMGPYLDPFCASAVRYTEDYVYCLGNTVLSYLNLAYNNLSYLSVRKLQNVINYQNITRGMQGGLIKVVVEGNSLPIDCAELTFIDNIMTKNALKLSGKSENIRRKSALKS